MLNYKETFTVSFGTAERRTIIAERESLIIPPARVTVTHVVDEADVLLRLIF
jgi:hypothetical protein